MDNTREIIEDMKNITMLTGEISSVHLVNLKKWPHIVFNNITGLEIKYDLTKDRTKETGEGFVEFYVEIENEEIEDFDKRCSFLAMWVRDMFWSEIRVSVFFNGKEKYKDSTLKDEKNGSN